MSLSQCESTIPILVPQDEVFTLQQLPVNMQGKAAKIEKDPVQTAKDELLVSTAPHEMPLSLSRSQQPP